MHSPHQMGNALVNLGPPQHVALLDVADHAVNNINVEPKLREVADQGLRQQPGTHDELADDGVKCCCEVHERTAADHPRHLAACRKSLMTRPAKSAPFSSSPPHCDSNVNSLTL